MGFYVTFVHQIRPGEPPEDGEMNEMTLSSRYISEAEHATFRSRTSGLRHFACCLTLLLKVTYHPLYSMNNFVTNE